MWQESRKELRSRRKLPGAIRGDDYYYDQTIEDDNDDHDDHGPSDHDLKHGKEIVMIQRVVRGQLERAQQGLEAAAR